MKKLCTIIVSSLLWCFFWINSFILILLGITVSLFVPRKCYNFIVHWICRLLTHSVLLFPKITKQPKEMPYPVIYVANHVSFFDLFISGTVLPGNPRGLELKSHFSKPIYGWFITRFGEIPIDSKSGKNLQESLKNAKSILDNKTRNILVMPEGTRSRSGELGRFHRGAFFLARYANVPVVPVVFKNLYVHNNAKSLAIHPGRVDVRILPPVSPSSFESDQEMAEHVKNLIAKELVDGQ